MSTEALIEQAHAAGVVLRLEGGRLKVRGKPSAVTKLLEPLRKHKDDLIRWFTQNDDLPRPLPREVLVDEYRLYTALLPPAKPLPPDPRTWRELAQAYHVHHFKCHQCQAAGRGARYALRCGVGAALWADYSTSI